MSKILKVTSEKEQHMENAANCPCNCHLLCINSKKVTIMGFHSLGTELGVYFFYNGLIWSVSKLMRAKSNLSLTVNCKCIPFQFNLVNSA